MSSQTKPFVPADFNVPATLQTAAFHLRMLAETDAELDYQAVMESGARLRAWSKDGWPTVDFTLEENRADLRQHEAEFHAREAFAYTVLSPDERQVLGCVYLYPNAEVDALIVMWVRDSAMALDTLLAESVQQWINQAWPFKQVRYQARP